jgi:phosphatidyl-myo-inositol dimannoside synthase
VTSEFPPGPGGIGDHASNLAEYLSNNNYTVHVLTELRTKYQVANKESERNWITYVPDKSKFRRIYFLIMLIRLAILKKPDIVIVSGMSAIQLMGLLSFFKKGRIVAILHGHELLMGGRFSHWWIKKSLKRFEYCVAVSEFSKQNAVEYIVNTKMKVIPNGIDTKRFLPNRIELKNQDRSINLLTVGRVSPRKGQHNVVEALPSILKVYPTLVYHIVGIPDYEDQVKERANRLGVSSSIQFHGAVSGNELNEILNRTDIFIMLSENQPNGDVEGFGIAILEANYFGVPAIGAKGCGIDQAIQDGHTGILVNAKDDKAIVDAISMINNKYKLFSNNAVAWAKLHAWKNIGMQYDQILTVME